MSYAAIAAIILAFSGKLAAFLSNMPTPIMGGIMLLLLARLRRMGARSLLAPNANVRSERTSYYRGDAGCRSGASLG